MQDILPIYVKKILGLLESYGHQAYVVGGAVRDLCLGRIPEDYDIATDAFPEKVALLANKAGWRAVGELGQNFGVTVLLLDGRTVEVATFRREMYGKDAHRPEKVLFGGPLEDDLSRRDFTINAMALDVKGDVIDPFAGRDDLAKKVLRTVGKASMRFAEDGLRMLRACRFCAQLGFTPDDELIQGIKEERKRMTGLSRERVLAEIEKLLLAPYTGAGLDMLVKSGLAGESFQVKKDGRVEAAAFLPELAALVDVPQNKTFHQYDVWGHTLLAVDLAPRERTVRWAALLHDIAKGREEIRSTGKNGEPTDHGHDGLGAKMAAEILRRFGYPDVFVKRVSWLVAQHMNFGFHTAAQEGSLLHWLRKEARSGIFRDNRQMQEAFRQLKDLCLADLESTRAGEENIEISRQYAIRLLELVRHMPVHTSDLAIGGKEAGDILAGEKPVGDFLRRILARVQDGNLANEREVLEQAAKNWQRRQVKDSSHSR